MADIQWQHAGQNFSANAAKSAGNEASRGFDFRAASTAWSRAGAIKADLKHGTPNEQRQLLDGYTSDGRPVRVGFTHRRDTIRIYTARQLTPKEEKELQRELGAERSTAERKRDEKTVRTKIADRRAAISERNRLLREQKKEREQAKKRENREDRER